LSEHQVSLSFGDNEHVRALYGEHDRNLQKIERQLEVNISSRGNQVVVVGPEDRVHAAAGVLNELYQRLERGQHLPGAEVDAVIRMALARPGEDDDGEFRMGHELLIKTPKKILSPYSQSQKRYIKALQQNEVVFANGPAGTGKTYMAVAMAVAMFVSRRVDRIILSRPAVEAGEKLGFLPGDIKEKIDPYLRPLYDALYDMLPAEKVIKHMENREIELAPLAFMRGRTLSNSYVILDEAQNCTPVQMKMFLTRLGENSRMVITGDLTQVDLPASVPSGLRDALEKLKRIDEIAVVHFDKRDVLRHPLAAKIVNAYEEWDRRRDED
jgi:phosphate starvation-inducible PhoH-like protein